VEIRTPLPSTVSQHHVHHVFVSGRGAGRFHNEGSMRPIHVITKKGTIVDCSPNALTAGSPAIAGGLTIEAVLSVLSQALPKRAIATYARLAAPILVGGNESIRRRLRVQFIQFGGRGGRRLRV